MAKSRLHELAARGQSVWFDTLSRELVRSGELKRMMDEDAVTGVTSNPSIFQKALSRATPTTRAEGAAREDRRRGGDLLHARAAGHPRRVRRPEAGYDAADGVDGYVSMEVEPGIAYDTERTFEQARGSRRKSIGRTST